MHTFSGVLLFCADPRFPRIPVESHESDLWDIHRRGVSEAAREVAREGARRGVGREVGREG